MRMLSTLSASRQTNNTHPWPDVAYVQHHQRLAHCHNLDGSVRPKSHLDGSDIKKSSEMSADTLHNCSMLQGLYWLHISGSLKHLCINAERLGSQLSSLASLSPQPTCTSASACFMRASIAKVSISWHVLCPCNVLSSRTLGSRHRRAYLVLSRAGSKLEHSSLV